MIVFINKKLMYDKQKQLKNSIITETGKFIIKNTESITRN